MTSIKNNHSQKYKQVKQKIQLFYRQKLQSAIQIQQMQIKQLYSLTNQVLQIKVSDQLYLLKIYQPSLPQFTNNQLETQIVRKLASDNLYPKILQSTSQYRIQQFISSQQVSQKLMNREKLISIVQKLASFSIHYAEFVSNYHKSKNTGNKFDLKNLQNIFQNIYHQKRIDCPQLVQKCQQQIKSVFFNNDIMNKLEIILKKIPKILCHNDCHLGNILSSDKKEYIIDYQFCDFNYIGYDVGNFLNEWATQYGVTFQIKDQLEMQMDLQKELINFYFQKLKEVYNNGDSEQILLYYIQVGRALSHLFWMIIGLKQINDSRICFSMIHYIKRRKQEFFKHFNEILKMNDVF